MSTVQFALRVIPSDLHSLSILLCCYGIAILVSLLGIAVYNVYFHPLAKFPGPKTAAVSRLSFARWALTGNLPFVIAELHDKYGDVVRIAPDELSYRDAQAWRDIYGQHSPKSPNFEKFAKSYPPPANGVDGLITAKGSEHGRQRRVLSHAFSDKALREQEPAIKSYVDLLISRLYKQVDCAAEGAVDITKWYNYTTFDMIGDFAFGESFNCLQDGRYHPWVSIIFESIKSGRFITVLNYFPRIARILKPLIIPESLIEKRRQNHTMSTEKVGRRLMLKSDRSDLISFMLRENDPQKEPLTKSEIETNASLIIVAGSETTATLLSGATFHLLKNPETYKKLTQEIRGSFGSSEEIGLASTTNLPYLQAVIEESLRLYPPAPAGFPRQVPESGAFISNQFVPGGTAVSVTNWAANQSSSNFVEPKSFIPERWLNEDLRFASDKRTAMQPFSVGQRNCIGKASAYAKTRLILTTVLWNFDLELCPDSCEWTAQQKVYQVWEKRPLMVRLVPVRRQ